MSPARREALLLAAVLVVLPLIVLWPLPLVFTTDVLTHPEREGATHIWGLWMAVYEHSPLILDTELLAWPDGTRLVLVDPGNVPLYALFGWLGPAAGYNGVLWGNVVLCGLGGALLARQVEGRMWLGAVVAICAAPVIAASSEGTTEDFAVGWVAIQLALLLRFADRGRWWDGVLASGALAMAFYGGPYNGIWALGLDAAVGVGLLARKRWPQAGRALGVGGLAGVFVAPQAWAVLTQRQAGLPGSKERAGLPDVFESADFRGGLHHGGDLLDPLLPVQLTGGEGVVSHTAYVGVIGLVLGCWAVWKRRELWPWLAGAGAFMLLSLGPYLYLRGQVLDVGDRLIPGPAGWLIMASDVFGRLTRWYRAGGVAVLLLAPLVSTVGAGWRGAIWAPLIVLDALLLAPLRWPLHTAAPPDVTPLEALPEGPILEMPPFVLDLPPEGQWRDWNLLAQTLHHRPVPATAMQLPLSPESQLATVGGQSLLRRGFVRPVPARAMAEQGYVGMAVYPALVEDYRDWRPLVEGCLGAPVSENETVVVYSLADVTTCIQETGR